MSNEQWSMQNDKQEDDKREVRKDRKRQVPMSNGQ
jgi:hypothetical protein